MKTGMNKMASRIRFTKTVIFHIDVNSFVR